MALLIHFVFNTTYTNASGFDESYSLRGGLTAINEAGYIIGTMKEVWKPVKGYEGRYEVSNLGNVCSLNYNRKKIRKNLSLNRFLCGYNSVSLYKNRISTEMLAHRIVAQAFISNPENKTEVNHKNSIRNDNRLENLEWVTPKENTQHAMELGRLNLPGEQSPRSKLTNRGVKEIRSKYVHNEYGYIRLGKEYGVSSTAIKNVVTRKTWKHI